MKIKFWGLAALSLAMVATSCRKETVETGDGAPGKLSFSAVVGKPTRATEWSAWASGDALNLLGFINGYNETTPYYDGVTTPLTYDGTAWQDNLSLNYPNVPVNFYAWYSPEDYAALDNAPTGTVAPVISYTVSSNPSTQEDLLAGATTATSANVTLTMDHVLSQVNFAITNIAGKIIQITDIAVNDVKGTGKYTFSTSGAGAWDIATSPETADYAYDLALTDESDPDALTPLTPLGNYDDGDDQTTDDYTHDNALMLLPQTFGTNAVGNFTFNYKIFDENNIEMATGSAQANFRDFPSSTWSAGKRYLYVIDFTDFFNGGPLKFSVNVNSWVDASSPEIFEQNIPVVGAASGGGIGAAISTHNNNINTGTHTTATVYPISLGAIPAADIMIRDFVFDNFIANDEIRINCGTTAGALKVSLHPAFSFNGRYWYVDRKNEVLIFKRQNSYALPELAPDVTAQTADLAGVNAAVVLQEAANATNGTYNVFTVFVPGWAPATGTTFTVDPGQFDSGDCLILVVPNGAAANVDIEGGTWTSETDGNYLTVKKFIKS